MASIGKFDLGVNLSESLPESEGSTLGYMEIVDCEVSESEKLKDIHHVHEKVVDWLNQSADLADLAKSSSMDIIISQINLNQPDPQRSSSNDSMDVIMSQIIIPNDIEMKHEVNELNQSIDSIDRTLSQIDLNELKPVEKKIEHEDSEMKPAKPAKSKKKTQPKKRVFRNLTENEILKLEENADSAKTKRQTKWAFTKFSGKY